MRYKIKFINFSFHPSVVGPSIHPPTLHFKVTCAPIWFKRKQILPNESTNYFQPYFGADGSNDLNDDDDDDDDDDDQSILSHL